MMDGSNPPMTSTIRNGNYDVPLVTFYSIQGGVGKSTLARRFAELVTVAPGRNGAKPNVLLIDLDVEAQGLSFRMTEGLRPGVRTIHEVLAERNAAYAQAMDVTMSIAIPRSKDQPQGKLFLVPAAPPNAQRIFETIATIEPGELESLLREVIQGLVTQNDISCVVIDCAPGANPYTAAAATLATVPLLIGRNESTTYEQIRLLPERFREWYPSFQTAGQRVIINAVTRQELYKSRADHYGVFDYLPYTGDVIWETEGLIGTEMMRTVLFNKYIADIMKRVLAGNLHLVPELPKIAGQEWVETLRKLERCEHAPKLRKLRLWGHLRWVGLALGVLGILLLGAWGLTLDDAPVLSQTLLTLAESVIVLGLAAGALGWYLRGKRTQLLADARHLVLEGPERVLEMLEMGASHRRKLEAMKTLAETIPEPPSSSLMAMAMRRQVVS